MNPTASSIPTSDSSPSEDADNSSWAVVFPTSSTPPTTPCVDSSTESPAAEGDSEIIVASSVEEPEDSEFEGVVSVSGGSQAELTASTTASRPDHWKPGVQQLRSRLLHRNREECSESGPKSSTSEVSRGIAEGLRISPTAAVHHRQAFQNSKSSTVDHTTGTCSSRTSQSQFASQFIGYSPSDSWTPQVVMQQQHPVDPRGFRHSNTLPMSQPETSMVDSRDLNGQVARPPYQYEMSRVASAAYSTAMKDAAQMQMMAAAQWARAPQQPIIIQNTTKAVAESQNEAKTTQLGPPHRPSLFDKWADFFMHFWESKLNRLLVMSLTGAGLYLYWEWWQHQRRMQMMQRRIEANPLLRLGQIISGVADGQRSQQPNAYY